MPGLAVDENLAVSEMPIDGLRGDSLFQVRIDRGEACASISAG
jgi:hypothetical protein